MSNVENILNQARAWFDCKESDGSHKEIIDTYNGHKPLARGYTVKYTDNWCMTFVSALFIKTGLASLCPLECSCGEAINLAKKMGIWEENEDITPSTGDLIMYDWDKVNGWPEHVGIIETVSGNQLTVIEGNKSNAVGRRTINVGDPSIRGYVRIKYDNSQPVQEQPVPQPSANAVDYNVKVNTPSGVNCRDEPNTSGSKITAYPNGEELHVTKEQNGWLFVNGIGWVCGEYCIKVKDTSTSKPLGEYKVVVNSALIVRTKPDANSPRKTKSQLTADGQKHSNANGGLLPDTIVTVSEWINGFAKIPSGYVSGDYLVKV